MLKSRAVVALALGHFLLSGIVANAADIKPASGEGTGLKAEKRVAFPDVAGASQEAEQSLKRFRVAPGLKADLWAAEPMLANPVAFCIDERGRIFVSETYRYRTSVLDIRHYMFMLEDDMACRNVDDRIAMCKKWFGEKAKDLTIESEVVRLVEDRDGDGKADFSAVYADKFNTMLDGIASGVLARKDKVWFTNIPELWLLEGTDKDGHALKRTSLSHGYGVRFSFTGHDMHGLTIGPDGRLYYSIGDRGSNVKTKEGKTIAYPDEGAVYRCELDGSNLEVVYHGLRNPQELTFDKYGNLFTGDNDFDHGDEERLVYIVEGGDSGWRVGYQHAPLGFDLVPWKSEHIWMSHNSRQADYNHKPMKNRTPDTGIRPAAYLPPISNIADGPSGFTYNPGVTALPPKYDDRFFLCHFKGATATSKVQSFNVKTKGAGFELGDSEPFIEETQPTDVDFGPDGAVYFSDWGEGWERTRKGRIYRVFDPNLIQSGDVLAVKQLINEGMDKRNPDDLVKLLAHRDRRVRQEAEFSLVERKATAQLLSVAKKNDSQLARLHAIWGLGILGRKDASVLDPILPLLTDADAEVRAQTVKVLGDARSTKAYPALITALNDHSSRVQMLAGIALGKLGNPKCAAAVIEMLRKNDNQDQFLRHGGVMALVGTGDAKMIASLATDKSAAVRLAAVLALRKLESPEIAVFLKDAEPGVVIETARAINDAAINTALPALANLLTKDAPVATSKWSQPFLLRAINAGFRVGDAPSAKAIAQFVVAPGSPDDMREEGLTQLALWGHPPQRDRIVGIYRPIVNRSPKPAAEALGSVINDALKSKSADVRIAAAKAAAELDVKEAITPLRAMVADESETGAVRSAALAALATLKDPKLNDSMKIAQNAKEESLRKEANRILGASGSAGAVKELSSVLSKGSVAEKQVALAALANIKAKTAEDIIGSWLDQLVANKVAPELQLDVQEAAAKRKNPAFDAKLKVYADSLSTSDPLAKYRVALTGGDAAAGRKIFYERADAQCLRCHKVKGEGSEVGPDLSDIAKRQNGEYILESIVTPNKTIAPGFESITLTLKSDEDVSGVFKSETDTEITVAIPDKGLVKVKKSDVASRRKGLSGMPEGFGDILSRHDLRDLVAFLSTLK